MRPLAFLLGFILLAAPLAFADDRAEKILKEIDDLWRGEASEALFEMEVKTLHYTRTMLMRAWSQGTDKTLVRIVEPIKEKGTASLKSGDNIYTYLPKTDRTIRLTSGMMMGSWMGSHFTNDDIVKESRLADDFDITITFEGERDGKKVFEFTLIPKPDAAVVWGKIVMVAWRHPDGNVTPLTERFYDEEMVVARTMTFTELENLGGRTLPKVMTVVPSDEPDEYTRLTYREIDFAPKLADDFFSLARLRSR